jgi:hypothetical protein
MSENQNHTQHNLPPGYNWEETAAEVGLRTALQEVIAYGDIHHFGGKTGLTVDATDQLLGRNVAYVGVKPNADDPFITQHSATNYELTPHSSKVKHIPWLGMGLAVSGLYTRGEGVAEEPYRVAISLGGPTFGTMILDMTVPSRQYQLEGHPAGSYLATPEEDRPPHLSLDLRSATGNPNEVIHMAKIIRAAKETVSTTQFSDDPTQGPRDAQEKQWALDMLQALSDATHMQVSRESEQVMSQTTMNGVRQFLGHALGV